MYCHQMKGFIELLLVEKYVYESRGLFSSCLTSASSKVYTFHKY